MKNKLLLCLVTVIYLSACTGQKKNDLDVQAQLDYCNQQVKRSLANIEDSSLLPINIMDSLTSWKQGDFRGWTSGFWSGILWYDYEYTQDESIREQAGHYTQLLLPLATMKADNHDLGFQVFCSYGHAYRLTGDEKYKQIILSAADTLATLFNPKVGTILSWPSMVKKKGWAHNTIIDNMMNLEMLLWASKNGGRKELYDIAVSHADVTMKNHFRDDYTNYHVAVYDTISGNFIKGVTHQGFSDGSMWARGQAWGVYGYAMMYRETQNKKYLEFGEKLLEPYLKRLPADLVPQWDFNAPDIEEQPRDASAAAIVASALLEMCQLETNVEKTAKYKQLAVEMLRNLSSEKYQSRDAKPSFLLHSTGHYPNGSEIDASIIYADYYYIEALMRLYKLTEKEKQ